MARAVAPCHYARMRLRRRVMPEKEFWSHIDVLGGSVDEDAVARLVDRLRERGRGTPEAFAERLAQVLYDLDRQDLFEQPVQWDDDPDDHVIPLSSDTFLYLRAGLVAKGKQAVDQAITDPRTLRNRRWSDGEGLLYAAEEAAGREIDTKYDYETGSNEAYWTMPSPSEMDGPRPPVAPILSDLLDPIDGEPFEGPGVESDGGDFEPDDLDLDFDWPLWFPEIAVDGALDAVVQPLLEHGGLPADIAAQVEVRVDFGNGWQVVPQQRAGVVDEFGKVVAVGCQLDQPTAKSWPIYDQERALAAVLARCVLTVLPDAHGARQALADVDAAGTDLLPRS